MKKTVAIRLSLTNIFYSFTLKEFKLRYLLELFLLVFFYKQMYTKINHYI